MHILFVCTGNICRSPIAERVVKGWVARHQLPSIFASSAGTHATDGDPIHSEAARALRALGCDPSNFAARQLTRTIASECDLVLTMTVAHRDALLQLRPAQLHRTFTLREASEMASGLGARGVEDFSSMRAKLRSHDHLDIADPFGKEPDEFNRTSVLIACLVQPILEVLRDSHRQLP